MKEEYTADAITAQILTTECKVQFAVRDGSTLSIYVVIPSVPANTGTTAISLSIAGFETPLSVPWEVIDDSQAYIASVFPQDGPITGYRIVTLEVRNWPAVFAQGKDGISVTFGKTQALAVRSVTEEDAGKKALISVQAPLFPAFGTVALTLSLKAGTDQDPVLAATFTFYSTCDFESYCDGMDQIVDKDFLASSPPADATCSFLYCIPRPLPPFLKDLSTYSIFDVGGDVVEAVVGAWPQMDLSLLSVKIVMEGSTTFCAASSVEARNDVDTVIRFETSPVVAKSGSATLVFVDTESGVSLAVPSSLQVFAYPQGVPVVKASPTKGISEDATPVFLELLNCPQSTPADVEVRFGNIRLDPLSFSSTRQSTTLTVAIPPRACTEDCSESVLVTVTDRFKKPSTASFAFTSLVPVPSAKSAFPVKGAATQQVRVTVVVENLQVMVGGQVRYVQSESDVTVDWAGQSVAPLEGSGVVSQRSFSFAFFVPETFVAQDMDVVFSVRSVGGEFSTTKGGRKEDDGKFIYTYLLEVPRLMSVVPARIPTAQPPLTKVKFRGQFFSAKGISATICDMAANAIACTYEPSSETIACEFNMPQCNKLGAGVLLVQADDLKGSTLELPVEFVVPPLQVLISSVGDDAAVISHTVYKKVGAKYPTAVTLYAWSAESNFALLVGEVSCRGLAFEGVSTKRLEAKDAAAVGLSDDTNNWWAIVATSPDFGGDVLAIGVVNCAVALVEEAEGYSFSLDLFQVPAIRYVQPTPGDTHPTPNSFFFLFSLLSPLCLSCFSCLNCLLLLFRIVKQTRSVTSPPSPSPPPPPLPPAHTPCCCRCLLVFTSGGQDLVVSISNFPPITRPDEMSLSIDSIKQLVRSVEGNSVELLLRVISPPMEAAGRFAVSISSPTNRYLPEIAFELPFEKRPPAILAVTPSVGSVVGGDIIDVRVLHMTSTESVEDFSVVVTSTESETYRIAETWTVSRIVYSDSSGTFLQVMAPPSGSAGTRSLKLTQKQTQETVFFQYQYFDPSMTVEAPGEACRDGGDAGNPNPTLDQLGTACVTRGALESPMRSLRLVARGLPAVQSRADVAVVFGTELGVVKSVEFDEDGKLLTVEVIPPQYTFDSAWEDDGWVAVPSHLFLKSDPATSAMFHTVYLRPLAVASAGFHSQFSFVDVVFNQPTNGGVTGTRTLCHTLIDVNDLERMGHDPAVDSNDCIWQSPRVLRVLYKPLPSQVHILAPGDTLRVRGGTLTDDGNHTSSVLLVDQDVVVLNDNAAAVPEAVLVGGTSLGFCDPLSLDAAASKGTRISYRWRCLNDDAMDEVLKSFSDPKISVAPSRIEKKDFSFKIGVTVTDFAGTSSTQQILEVYRSSSPLPTILIESKAEIFVEPDAPVLLSGKAEFAACVEPSEILFNWFVGQQQAAGGGTLQNLGGDNAMEGLAGSAREQYEIGGRTVFVYPHVLIPGESYTFQLTGAPVDQLTNVGSATVVVHVRLPPLVANIAGGSRDVSSSREIVLDGSKSRDPSGMWALSYTWSCVVVFQAATQDICRHKTTREVLKFEDAPTVTLVAGELADGFAYDFMLQVTDYKGTQQGSRFATTSVSLTVVASQIPDAGILVNDAVTKISKTGQVNADTKIVLTGVASNVPEASASVRVEGEWEVSLGGNGVDLSNVDVAPLGFQSPDFILNGKT